MESEGLQAYDSQKISRSRKLRIFTKLLREPIVVSGSAYRSGAHPVLATRVAAEVARSPKCGLVQKLMEEGRLAFTDKDYPRAIVKSLAAEELLRKYGGVLAPDEESEIREQLQFLKIQYFLLSGQAGEAYKVFREVRHRSHPYLWHRRLASRSGVDEAHWTAVERTLRQFFKTNRSAKIFSLLGYAVVMGPDPSRVVNLAEELGFDSSQGDRLFDALYSDYSFLVTRVTQKVREFFPHYLAKECRVTPLIKQGDTLFVGASSELNEIQLKELEVRTDSKVVAVPMSSKPLQERNFRLYAS
jgi:hypothetical protein